MSWSNQNKLFLLKKCKCEKSAKPLVTRLTGRYIEYVISAKS